MSRETRARLAEIRAVTDDDGTRSVELHCITPGVVDDYGSVWMPDVFDDSLGRRLPTLCWAHSWSEPLGRGVDYRTSSTGPDVIFEFDDFDDVPQARRAFSQVRSGTITDCSVGFSNTQRRDPTDAEREQWPGVREVILKADLDEVSLVLAGAVPGAKVLAIRSADGAGEVSEDAWLAVAKKVAAGELTVAEGKAALAIAADGGEEGDGTGGAPSETPPPDEPDPEQAAELEELFADADAALDVVGRSR